MDQILGRSLEFRTGTGGAGLRLGSNRVPVLACPACRVLGCGALAKRHLAKRRFGSRGARGRQLCGGGISREGHGWRHFPPCLGLEGPIPLRFRGADESDNERDADTLFLSVLIDVDANLTGAGRPLSIGNRGEGRGIPTRAKIRPSVKCARSHSFCDGGLLRSAAKLVAKPSA